MGQSGAKLLAVLVTAFLAAPAVADVEKPANRAALHADAKANPKDKAKLKAYLLAAAEDLKKLSIAKDADGVLGLAIQMEEMHPGLYSVHYYRGVAYLQKKLYGQAVSDLEQARAIANRQAKPRPELDLNLAWAKFGENEFDAVVRSLTNYEKHGGKMDEELYLLLITTADRGGQQQRAIDTIKLAIAQYPANADFQKLAKRYEKVMTVASREQGMSESGTLHFSTKFETQSNVPEVRQLVERTLEAAYDRVTVDLGAYPVATVPVVVYASQDSYHANTETPDWMGAHYNSRDGQIRLGEDVIRIGETALMRMISHELSHRILDEITQHNIPHWLSEGLAQIEEARSMERSERMIEGMLIKYEGKLLPLQLFLNDMTAGGKVEPKWGYAISWSATRYLIAKFGQAGMQKALQRLGKGDTIETVFGMTYEQFQQEWTAAEIAAHPSR